MLLKQDFFYNIPSNLIAQDPVEIRDQSRLLIANAKNMSIEDNIFCNLHLRVNDLFNLSQNNSRALFIINDSRVFPARVRITRQTGAQGEVFILNRKPELNKSDNTEHYNCLLRPQSKLKIGEILYSQLNSKPIFKVANLNPPQVSLYEKNTLDEVLKIYGEMPLPPYIERNPKKISHKSSQDLERYQTVYSDENKLGSSAAPTAGLHFTDQMVKNCQSSRIEFASVTLHVGLGTFAPVKSDDISEHPMHEEFYFLSHQSLKKIAEYIAHDWPIIYVGTTSLRTVESFFRSKFSNTNGDFCSIQDEIKTLAINNKLEDIFLDNVNKWTPTNLFIFPKNKQDKTTPCIGNAILTNFHQPESTLVMLISSLVGYNFWKEIYTHAIKKEYRFFSYGDSSLLIF